MSAEILAKLPDTFEPVRLTLKQRLFVDFYVGPANFNATEAAMLAGYSPKTATNIGSENLRKPYLAREIKARLDLMGLTTEEITGRLGQMARGEIPTKTSVKGLETTTTYDERGALEDLARIQGMFIDRHQVQPIQALLIEDA